MPNPTWPATLPQFVNQDSYREARTDNTIRTPMEGAAVKTRRRFTASFRRYQFAIWLSKTQKGYLDTFYKTTCADGSLAFDWVLPAEQSAASFLFMGPIQYSAAGPQTFVATFDVQTTTAI